MQQKEERIISQMPPRAFMEQIMDKLGKIYCFLWDLKDEDGKLYLRWVEITDVYQKNSFRSCLRKLKCHKLLTYKETDDGIRMEIFGWD